MEFLLSGLTHHGYSILFAIVFMEAIGIPVPAAVALLIAGGSLSPSFALADGLSAMLLADTLMFLMGRYTGWWLLGLLCRLSLNPESCILRSADSFYRRGRILLLFAKFVPGINSMAPPLAGSMNMRLGPFLRLDSAGVSLYVGFYLSLGYISRGVLGSAVKGYRAFGHVLGWVLIAAAAAYLGVQVWMWTKARVLRFIPTVSPYDAARELSSGEALIYDVRSHGYYDRTATRAQGSRRLEPNALLQSVPDIPRERLVLLYCSCVREATSARVAHELLGRGVPCVVIKGGLRAWKKGGLPIEQVPSEEIAALPVFES